jgi:hypothetical protein
VSSCEALWCLNLFAMQEHDPTVVCLQVHLPEQQSVIFNPEGGASIQDMVESHRNKDTTLTGWFKANSQWEDCWDLLYQDFPSRMVWKKDRCKWKHRENDGFAIGRMYHAHPTSGECFFLSLPSAHSPASKVPPPSMTFALLMVFTMTLSRRPVLFMAS